MSDAIRAVPKPSQKKADQKKAKSDTLSAQQRQERARNAANAMWAKRRAAQQKVEESKP